MRREKSSVVHLKRLWLIPLIIPVVVCGSAYVLLTRVMHLPALSWAIVLVAFGALWYLLVWLAVRRADRVDHDRDVPTEARTRASVLRRALRSPGGLVLILLACWLSVQRDWALATTTAVVGIVLIAVAPRWRR